MCVTVSVAIEDVEFRSFQCAAAADCCRGANSLHRVTTLYYRWLSVSCSKQRNVTSSCTRRRHSLLQWGNAV